MVDSSRNLIYITDSGIPVNNTLYPYKPGLIIFDVEKRTSRRVLDSAHSTNYVRLGVCLVRIVQMITVV